MVTPIDIVSDTDFRGATHGKPRGAAELLAMHRFHNVSGFGGQPVGTAEMRACVRLE